ncbi:hypothetical protein BJ170DRAFT_711981 [Xylariales sp. AK1849]|nr:hypothetical protein BJ170DRAFT_711981 [Xylariales sp. AK1849]
MYVYGRSQHIADGFNNPCSRPRTSSRMQKLQQKILRVMESQFGLCIPPSSLEDLLILFLLLEPSILFIHNKGTLRSIHLDTWHNAGSTTLLAGSDCRARSRRLYPAIFQEANEHMSRSTSIPTVSKPTSRKEQRFAYPDGRQLVLINLLQIQTLPSHFRSSEIVYLTSESEFPRRPSVMTLAAHHWRSGTQHRGLRDPDNHHEIINKIVLVISLSTTNRVA